MDGQIRPQLTYFSLRLKIRVRFELFLTRDIDLLQSHLSHNSPWFLTFGPWRWSAWWSFLTRTCIGDLQRGPVWAGMFFHSHQRYNLSPLKISDQFTFNDGRIFFFFFLLILIRFHYCVFCVLSQNLLFLWKDLLLGIPV